MGTFPRTSETYSETREQVMQNYVLLGTEERQEHDSGLGHMPQDRIALPMEEKR